MTTTTPKTPSAFGEAALALDAAFQRFEQLARELERLDVASDKGLERAGVLLGEVDDCRQRLAAAMQDLSRTLEEARARSEAAAQQIQAQVAVIEARQQEASLMLARFKALGEMVKQVNSSVAALRSPSSGALSAEDQEMLVTQWPDLDEKLGLLVTEARKLMDDAHAANMRLIERNADSLRQTLQAARHKLGQFVERNARPPVTH